MSGIDHAIAAKLRTENQLVHKDSDGDVIADQSGDAFAQPQVQRTIGRGGVAPVLGDLEQKRAGVDRWSFGIRVEAITDHRTLHEVGIHIAGGQGGCQKQWQNPRPHCLAHPSKGRFVNVCRWNRSGGQGELWRVGRCGDVASIAPHARGDDEFSGKDPRSNQQEHAHPKQRHADISAVSGGDNTNVEGFENAATVAGSATSKRHQG